jgi:ketosteroid isomerase-like protein
MRTALFTLAVLALASGAAKAHDVNEPTQQTAQSPMTSTLDKAVIANERKLNDAVGKGDKAAFLAMIAPGAWMADENGFMKVADLAATFEQLKIANWTIADEKVLWADANTAIVTYKWTGSGTYQGQPVASPTYASTVWAKKGDKWVALYHQESAAKK